MNQTSYSPDKFGTYLAHPGCQGCDIDLSSANVLEILLAYRAFRQTLNVSYSTIKLYCNQLKAALEWASRHGCLLSWTYNDFKLPRYFKSRVALTPEEICHVAHFRGEKVFRTQVHEDLRTVYHLRRRLNGAGQPASFLLYQFYISPMVVRIVSR